LKADFLLKIAFLVKNVTITRRNIVNKVVFILDRRIDMKIKSVPQLVDLVRAEKVNFTQTPQINGTDIPTGHIVKAYEKPVDPIGKIFAPEVYYKFDSDFSDSSDFGRTATTAGTVAPTIQTSIKKFGEGALKVSADGQIKYLVDSSTSGVSGAIPMHQYQIGWTLSTWFYATSVPDESFVVAIKWTFGGYTTNDRIFYVDTGGNLIWARNGAANVQLLNNSSHPLCDSAWHHIAFTFWQWDPNDPGAIKIRAFYDGTNVGVAAVSMPSWAGAVGKTFGSNGDASGGKDFYLDDFMFTNYPLGPDIITEIWNGGTGKRADEAGIKT
jgi:hypothetical protein